MENNEFRGLNDGIILYVLKSGDRHTDELKAIIDEKFFEIKTITEAILFALPICAIPIFLYQKLINSFEISLSFTRGKSRLIEGLFSVRCKIFLK